MDELKPCPFCGSYNVQFGVDDYSRIDIFFCWCLDCEAEGPVGKNKEEAIDWWNRRAGEDG